MRSKSNATKPLPLENTPNRWFISHGIEKLYHTRISLEHNLLKLSTSKWSDWPSILWKLVCILTSGSFSLMIILFASPLLILLLIQAGFTTYLAIVFFVVRLVLFYMQTALALGLIVSAKIFERSYAGMMFLFSILASPFGYTICAGENNYDMDIPILEAEEWVWKDHGEENHDIELLNGMNMNPWSNSWTQNGSTAPPSPKNVRLSRRNIPPPITMTSTTTSLSNHGKVIISDNSITIPLNKHTLTTPIGMIEPTTPLQSAHDAMEDYFFTEKGEWKRQMEERSKVRSRSSSVSGSYLTPDFLMSR